MKSAIEQAASFAKVTPADLYELFMDSAKHSAATEPGGHFVVVAARLRKPARLERSFRLGEGMGRPAEGSARLEGRTGRQRKPPLRNAQQPGIGAGTIFKRNGICEERIGARLGGIQIAKLAVR